MTFYAHLVDVDWDEVDGLAVCQYVTRWQHGFSFVYCVSIIVTRSSCINKNNKEGREKSYSAIAHVAITYQLSLSIVSTTIRLIT